MRIDYHNLKDKMSKQGYNQKLLARKMNISEGQLCKKISGEYAFKQSEILKICNILDIDKMQIADYFFTELVEKSQSA